MPRGSFYLDCVLFNIFVNNLNEWVNCMLIKFTDDTKRGGVANIGWPDFLSENLDHLSWQAHRGRFLAGLREGVCTEGLDSLWEAKEGCPLHPLLSQAHPSFPSLASSGLNPLHLCCLLSSGHEKFTRYLLAEKPNLLIRGRYERLRGQKEKEANFRQIIPVSLSPRVWKSG